MTQHNPYAGMRYSELCGIRKDYAKMLHAAVAARKVAERNMVLISQALRDAVEPKPFEASDHSVIRYLERVEGVDIGAIRETITMNCEQGAPLIGDKLRGMNGFLYCVNGDGFVTTVLPLDAVADEAAEQAAAMRERPLKNGRRRRGIFAKEAFVASCDTHPKDGDVKQAPLGSGAVPSETSADAQPSSGSNRREEM